LYLGYVAAIIWMHAHASAYDIVMAAHGTAVASCAGNVKSIAGRAADLHPDEEQPVVSIDSTKMCAQQYCKSVLHTGNLTLQDTREGKSLYKTETAS
jgi:hypothetical protein